MNAQVELIKKEIERRIEETAKAPSDNGIMDSVLGARVHELMTLLSFIATLSDEPPADGLEEEIKSFFDGWHIEDDLGLVKADGWTPNLSDIFDIARHFAEWQKEQMMKDIKLAYGKVSMNPFDCSEAFEELIKKYEPDED